MTRQITIERYIILTGVTYKVRIQERKISQSGFKTLDEARTWRDAQLARLGSSPKTAILRRAIPQSACQIERAHPGYVTAFCKPFLTHSINKMTAEDARAKCQAEYSRLLKADKTVVVVLHHGKAWIIRKTPLSTVDKNQLVKSDGLIGTNPSKKHLNSKKQIA
jgi:hypothetical protein